MRVFVIVISLTVVLATCAALAPGQSAPPTSVRQIGVYQCPNHPEIQATWPAQCPSCGTVLQTAQPFNAARAGTVFVADANYYRDQRNQPYGSQRNGDARL